MATSMQHPNSILCMYNVLNINPYILDLYEYTHISYDPTIKKASVLDLLHSINGRQMSLLEAEGDQRFKDSLSCRGFIEVTRRIVTRLYRRIDGWRCAETMDVAEEDEMLGMIHLLSLEWGAWNMVGLTVELEAHKKGKEHYKAVYEG